MAFGNQLLVKSGGVQLPYKMVKWTGDGSSTRTITGVGFQAGGFWLLDSSTTIVRVYFESIYNNILEWLSKTGGSGGRFYTTFNSDGVTFTNTEYNVNGVEYTGIFWNTSWTPHSNTTGTYNATIDSNPDAGFSVSRHNAAVSSSPYTMPHELDTAPKFIIGRIIEPSYGGNPTSWAVYHPDAYSITPFDSTLRMSDAQGLIPYAPPVEYYAGPITDTVNTYGPQFQGRLDYGTLIVFNWAETEGISKMSSYTGNGGSKSVTTGFKVGFLLIKRIDTSGNWLIFNDVTEPSNPKTSPTYANGIAVSGTYSVTFNDTGFVINNSNADCNANGGDYIYMAIVTAEE